MMTNCVATSTMNNQHQHHQRQHHPHHHHHHHHEIADDASTSSSSSSSGEESPKQLRSPRKGIASSAATQLSINSPSNSPTKSNGQQMSRRQRKNRKSNQDLNTTIIINEKENKEPNVNRTKCDDHQKQITSEQIQQQQQQQQQQHSLLSPSKKRSAELAVVHHQKPKMMPSIGGTTTTIVTMKTIKTTTTTTTIATITSKQLFNLILSTGLSMAQIERNLRKYAVPNDLLRPMGFPYNNGHNQVLIYKMPFNAAARINSKGFDVNAPVFKPRPNKKRIIFVNEIDGLQVAIGGGGSDSGHGSGSGSETPTSSNASGGSDCDENIATGATEEPVVIHNSIIKGCSRCNKNFTVNENGEYKAADTCRYHWGKRASPKKTRTPKSAYLCCDSDWNGCCTHKYHVWTGIQFGNNGPYDGYVRTQAPTQSNQSSYGVYGLDCEMCFTVYGLELTKVTIINVDGTIKYETFVRPEAEIIDYNTRFSGITEDDLHIGNANVRTLAQVQCDILKFISSETLLIGHGLENDFRALKLLHSTILDTSHLYSHDDGLPYRRSLKQLADAYLNRTIQDKETGHDCREDSQTCVDLAFYSLCNDLELING